LPWIALTAGIVAATVAIGNAANAQNNFNQIMAYAPLEEVQAKVKGLENQLIAAEQKLQTQIGLYGDLSSQALFAQASVDALRGALEQAQGDYQVRLLYQTVGVTPDARFLGPGFKAPQPKAKPFALPTSTSKPTKGGGKAADEAKRLAAAIAGSKSQLALTKAKFEIEGKMLQAQQDDDKALQIRLTAQGKFAEIRQQIADIRADKEMKAEQKLLEIQNQEILGLGVAREMVFGLAEFQKTEDQRKLDAVKAYLEKQYELNTSVQQQLQLADSVSGILGQGMTSAFDALIQGSEDFGKSLRNIASGALVDIAKQLIRIYIIEQAINSIKSFLTPFSSATPLGAGGGQVGRFGTFGPNYGIKQYAAGGTPPVGRPSLVGERGPELFMPGVRGSIIPNHALGGGTTNVVVNVDASGSSVEGDQSQAKALGNAISAAVQSELVKQKRPGGLLA
jgi:hypothetical protein